MGLAFVNVSFCARHCANYLTFLFSLSRGNVIPIAQGTSVSGGAKLCTLTPWLCKFPVD